MRHKTNILTAIVVMTCMGIVACQKESTTIDKDSPPEIQKASDIKVANLNPEAVTFYENIKTAVFATGSNLPGMTRSAADENPLIEKLESIDIVKDETSADVSFFEMDEVEQKLFLDDWALVQAEQLNQKIADNPELAEIIRMENEVISSVLNEETTQTRSGELKINDTKVFFAKIQQRMEEKSKEITEAVANKTENDDSKTRIGISSGSKSIPWETLRSNLVRYARKGDFLLQLPMHGDPGCLLNFSNGNMVGHAGIISEDVMYSHEEDDVISIGAQYHKNAVSYENMKYWSVKSYIMGIQKVKWVWKWRGFKSGFYRTCTPVSNPEALARWAEGYIGVPYLPIGYFPIAKWCAPKEFICTTLVWWCAKKAYDINVSHWWVNLVTPSGLFTDESTYIRKENR